MTTERQIAANRQDAQKSTGPRTPAGKAIASRNNTPHGLRSTTPVHPQARITRRLAATPRPHH